MGHGEDLVEKEESRQEEIGKEFVAAVTDDLLEENIGKYPAKGEELKEISITGVSALKIEGKGTIIPEKEKKPMVAKSKPAKESKGTTAKGQIAAPPANLSIMVS